MEWPEFGDSWRRQIKKLCVSSELGDCTISSGYVTGVLWVTEWFYPSVLITFGAYSIQHTDLYQAGV